MKCVRCNYKVETNEGWVPYYWYDGFISFCKHLFRYFFFKKKIKICTMCYKEVKYEFGSDFDRPEKPIGKGKLIVLRKEYWVTLC